MHFAKIAQQIEHRGNHLRFLANQVEKFTLYKKLVSRRSTILVDLCIVYIHEAMLAWNKTYAQVTCIIAMEII